MDPQMRKKSNVKTYPVGDCNFTVKLYDNRGRNKFQKLVSYLTVFNYF